MAAGGSVRPALRGPIMFHRTVADPGLSNARPDTWLYCHIANRACFTDGIRVGALLTHRFAVYARIVDASQRGAVWSASSGLTGAEGVSDHDVVAELTQAFDDVGGEGLFNRQLVRLPLVMDARSGHRFRQRHAQIDVVHDRLQHLGN